MSDDKAKAKDCLDGHLVAWFRGSAMKGDRCRACDGGFRSGASCYVERVLPGVNVRPHTLHRSCWKKHLDRTAREARKVENERRAEQAVELADRVL